VVGVYVQQDTQAVRHVCVQGNEEEQVCAWVKDLVNVDLEPASMQETLKSGVVLCELVNSFPILSIFANSGNLRRYLFLLSMKGLCDMGPIAGK
jgi:hypothetical protein